MPFLVSLVTWWVIVKLTSCALSLSLILRYTSTSCEEMVEREKAKELVSEWKEKALLKCYAAAAGELAHGDSTLSCYIELSYV
jgi:hypothetical protein